MQEERGGLTVKAAELCPWLWCPLLWRAFHGLLMDGALQKSRSDLLVLSPQNREAGLLL